jgi:hypothetical protein
MGRQVNTLRCFSKRTSLDPPSDRSRRDCESSSPDGLGHICESGKHVGKTNGVALVGGVTLCRAARWS